MSWMLDAETNGIDGGMWTTIKVGLDTYEMSLPLAQLSRSRSPVRGGMLCEAMGLGKTIICLGVIVLNKTCYHNGVSCDASGQSPIEGPWHRRRTGEEYDLCEVEFLKLEEDEKENYEVVSKPGAAAVPYGARAITPTAGPGDGSDDNSALVDDAPAPAAASSARPSRKTKSKAAAAIAKLSADEAGVSPARRTAPVAPQRAAQPASRLARKDSTSSDEDGGAPSPAPATGILLGQTGGATPVAVAPQAGKAPASAAKSGGATKPPPRVAATTAAGQLPKSGATLVVCAVSLVSQWIQEAKSKTTNALNIYSYHGTKRTKDVDFLLRQDIVVTTYGTLTAEAALDEPPLEQLEWYRVVLDESHSIKSPTTKAAQACNALKAERRWCVSGTPIATAVGDIASQLDFVGLASAASAARWPKFGAKGYYSRVADNSDCFKYFSLLYCIEKQQIINRHVHGQKINGQPILELPRKSEKVQYITLDTKEKKIYTDAHDYYAKRFLSIPQGLRGKSTLSILGLLLPLRQMCSGGAQEAPKKKQDQAKLQHECPVCDEIATDPVQSTKCAHVYCRDCITNLLAQGIGTEPCPNDACSQEITIKHIKGVDEQDSSLTAAQAKKASGFEEQIRSFEDLSKASPSSSYYYNRFIQKLKVKLFKIKPWAAALKGFGSTVANAAVEAAEPVALAQPAQPDLTDIVFETKVAALLKNLTRISGEDKTSKVLVFSQFSSTLRRIQQVLPTVGLQYVARMPPQTRVLLGHVFTRGASTPQSTVRQLDKPPRRVGRVFFLVIDPLIFVFDPITTCALPRYRTLTGGMTLSARSKALKDFQGTALDPSLPPCP